MGIKGLLLNTKSVGRPRNIADYRDKTVGIDGYAWLHKALHCSGKWTLYTGNYLEKFVHYFQRNIQRFLELNIKVVIVFDGDKLPIKAKTETERYLRRKENYDRAMETYKRGEKTLAYMQYFEAIDVSPAMAFYVKRRLTELFSQGLEFVVAPYEADSQLAYLSRIGYIDVVITEDSDLLVFGAKVIFYKMNREFFGIEYSLQELQRSCSELDFSGWSQDRFVQFCVLSGCDYVANPPGVGIKRAFKLVDQFGEFRAFYPQIIGKVDSEYQFKFLAAYLSFKYALVYCPLQRKAVHLAPLDAGVPEFDKYAFAIAQKHFGGTPFLGHELSGPLAFQVANMLVDPITKESFISGYESMYNTKKKPKGRSIGKRIRQKTVLSRSMSLILPPSGERKAPGDFYELKESDFHDLCEELFKSQSDINVRETKRTKRKLVGQVHLREHFSTDEPVLPLPSLQPVDSQLEAKQTKKKSQQLAPLACDPLQAKSFSQEIAIAREYEDLCERLHGMAVISANDGPKNECSGIPSLAKKASSPRLIEFESLDPPIQNADFQLALSIQQQEWIKKYVVTNCDANGNPLKVGKSKSLDSDNKLESWNPDTTFLKQFKFSANEDKAGSKEDASLSNGKIEEESQAVHNKISENEKTTVYKKIWGFMTNALNNLF